MSMSNPAAPDDRLTFMRRPAPLPDKRPMPSPNPRHGPVRAAKPGEIQDANAKAEIARLKRENERLSQGKK
jgi:hypothetical protein